jgi:hypothetical protein
MDFKRIHVPKRKFDEMSKNGDDDDDGDGDQSFKYDKYGRIIGYPKNIKFVDAKAFNLDVQEEDSDLIHMLVHIATGLLPMEIKLIKDAITLHLLPVKDLSSKETLNYIIQLKFPKVPISLDELTQIKLYSPDRISNIIIDHDEEEKKAILNIHLLSSTNHIYYKSRTLYVGQSSVQHYSIYDNTVNYDTNFLKRQNNNQRKKPINNKSCT